MDDQDQHEATIAETIQSRNEHFHAEAFGYVRSATHDVRGALNGLEPTLALAEQKQNGYFFETSMFSAQQTGTAMLSDLVSKMAWRNSNYAQTSTSGWNLK